LYRNLFDFSGFAVKILILYQHDQNNFICLIACLFLRYML
jgi:hypothetical protein